MKINAQFWTLFTWRSVVAFIILPWFLFVQMGAGMKLEKRRELRDEAKDMFYHGYRAYMENAYPADELMPLTCKGRWRDTESRGDVDDVLGNFSLTLIDSLDTLVVLGDFEEFEHGIREVIKNVHFDHDIVVSVFETNIRVLGGLLSAHALATYLQQRTSLLPWYKDELLTKAQDLGYRLLPAFNTTTGIPYSRINLRHGVSPPKLSGARETCTACAGTMILELAALSRLSGEPIFEEKGHKAMDALWSLRHRSSDLMGTVLNIDSGDWIRRDSGVGAGIDSYYEYCLKAYVLLGDDRYLERFNKHYSAVMRYISQGPMLLDVHMHRPHTNSKNFMDSLLAFWPGLQVLKGDLKPAVETHEMLYQVMQRHNFLPEAFTTDFQVHWGQHPLRPEFVESTYFLYRATGDPYYLEVGEKVLRSLQKYARVPCGYAAVKDVRTGQHEDRMDSFVLAETFKYLYLLFAEPEDLPLRLDDFVFTTEGHLFPLSLARLSNLTAIPLPETYVESPDDDVDHARSCPSAQFLFPGPENSVESIRKPLKNFVDKEFRPVRKSIKRNLRAHDFQAGNAEHMQLLKAMGITIVALPDGRVQLLHTFSNAHSAEDAEEGLMFMQEMVELSRSLATQPENPPKTLTYTTMLITHTEDGLEVGEKRRKHLKVGPAQFGLELIGDVKVSGFMAVANPVKLCSEADNAEGLRGKIVYVERGDCMFIDKARRLQRVGALGGIVGDNQPAPVADAPLFAMSGDGEKDVNIPMVFMYKHDAWNLLEAFRKDPTVYITLSEHPEQDGFGTAEMARIDEEAPTLPELSQDATHEALKVNIEEFVRQHSHEAETRAGGSEGSKRQTVGETYIIRLGEDGQLMTEKIPAMEQGQGLGTISRIERLADGNSGMESAEEKMSTTNPTWQHEKGSRASKDNTLTSQAKGEAVPVTAAKYELPSYWESKTASEDLGIHASSGPSKTSLSDRKYLLQMVRFSLRTLLSLEPELNQVKDWKASSKEDLQELDGLASDLRSVVIEVFESQRRSLKDGIARKHTDGYESSFKLLWPTFPWPNTYLEEMIFLLQSVARDREFEPEDKPLINDVTLLNKLSKLLEESEGQSRVDSGEHKGTKETGLTKEELENLRSLHPDLLDIPDDENALRRKAKKLLVAALIGKTRKEHRQKAVRRRRKSESTDLPMPKLRPGDEF